MSHSACPPSLPPHIKPGTSRSAVRPFVTPDAVHPLLFHDRTFDSKKLKAYYSEDRKVVPVYAPHFDQQGNPLSRNSIKKHTKYLSEVCNTPEGPIAFQTSDYSAYGKVTFHPSYNSIKAMQAMFAVTPAGHYHLQIKDRYE